MSCISDHADLPIPCPECGHETSQKIGWLKTNDQFPCAGCGKSITLDSAEFLRELQGVEKTLEQFGASVSKHIRIDP